MKRDKHVLLLCNILVKVRWNVAVMVDMSFINYCSHLCSSVTSIEVILLLEGSSL